MDTLKLYGVPGSGKTTRGLKWLGERFADGCDPWRTAFVSFTNAAVDEAKARISRDFNLEATDLPYCRTIHSLCKRQLQDLPDDWQAEKHLHEFGQTYGYDMGKKKGKIDDGDDIETLVSMSGKDAPYLQIWDFARHRLIEDPRAAWDTFYDYAPDSTRGLHPNTFLGWLEDYKKWKLASGLMDFTDLLLRYIAEGEPTPVELAVLDECVPGDTLVTLADGSQASIEKIVEERLPLTVACYNERLGTVESKPVIGWHKVPLRGRPLVGVGPLAATGNHPVYTLENGYTPSEKCKVLCDSRTLHALYLDHEKLRSEREVNANRTIHRDRVTSWRRLCKPPIREERELADEFRSRVGSTGVFEVEILQPATVVPHAPDRTSLNELWGNGLPLHHDIPSGLHRDVSPAASPQRTEATNRRISGMPGRSGYQCLVYGRRLTRRDSIIPVHPRAHGPGCLLTGGIPKGDWHQSQSIRTCQRPDPRFGGKRHGSTDGTSVPLHPSGPVLQNPRARNTSRGSDCPRPDCAFAGLRGVRSFVSSVQVNNNLRQRGVRAGTTTAAHSKMEKGKSFSDGNDQRHLRGMRCDVSIHSAEKTKQATASNLRASVPEKTEQWVYCLDVADHHNFFANGVLVHNCQDMSPALWKAARLLFANADYTAILGDDDQAINCFMGSEPKLMNEQNAHEVVKLEHSWRCPASVARLAQSIIRLNRNREAKTISPRDGAEGTAETIYDLSDVDLLNGESWGVMSRNWKLLDHAAELLEARGVPYLYGGWRYSPWCDRGPLRAVKAVLRLRSTGACTHDELQAVASKSNMGTAAKDGVWVKGAKKAIKELADSDPNGRVAFADLPDLGLTEWGLRKLLTDSIGVLTTGVSERDLGAYDKALKGGTMEAKPVTLTSIHGWKGREFDNAIGLLACGMQTAKAMSRADGQEEERRVAYVAVTRARKRFYALEVPPMQNAFEWDIYRA